MDQNLVLIGYAVPLLLGLVLISPMSQSLVSSFVERQPRLAHERRRHMLGLNLVALTGFVVSVHTLWITNKISEGGNVCSSATVFPAMMCWAMPPTTPTHSSEFHGD